jgi:hypothetical protein
MKTKATLVRDLENQLMSVTEITERVLAITIKWVGGM